MADGAIGASSRSEGTLTAREGAPRFSRSVNSKRVKPTVQMDMAPVGDLAHFAKPNLRALTHQLKSLTPKQLVFIEKEAQLSGSVNALYKTAAVVA